MKRALNTVFAKATFIFIVLFPISSLAGQFTVIHVYDGDTIKVEGHDVEVKVRLIGIDAPETSRKKRDPGQPFSQQAKKHLAGLVLNKVVEVKGYGLDGYNRILGLIFLGDKNINLEMVRVGLAEVYRGNPPHGFDSSPYMEVENEARASGRGMWSLEGKYVSPKEWRRIQKER
jgi:endonuclease YncB( thermonuclease family)